MTNTRVRKIYAITALFVFIVNGILHIMVNHQGKGARIAHENADDQQVAVYQRNATHRSTLSKVDTAGAAWNSTGRPAEEAVPPWEDTVVIKEDIGSHRRTETLEELTMSVLWRADQVKRLQNGLRIEYNQRNEPLRENPSPEYNLTIFTLNYDAGPVQAVRNLLEPWGIRFIDHSYSSYCSLTATCVKNLQAVNKANSFEPQPSLIDKFYEVYQHSEGFESVDAFLCIDPPAICDLFLSFNKSLFVLAGSRYELGHSSPARWKMWNDRLQKIAFNRHNIVASTNTYDAEYMRYFAEISPTILQYPCQYISGVYSPPEKVQFLLFPTVNQAFAKYFLEAVSQHSHEGYPNVSVNYVKEGLSNSATSWRDMRNYSGMVLIPNDASSLTMTELYRMNIPMFVPTLQLLSRWHMRFRVVTKRTLASSRNLRHQGSSLPPTAKSSLSPDPNKENNIESVSHWLRFCDIYLNPHLILFSSIRDLLIKMEMNRNQESLQQISRKMAAANKVIIAKSVAKWKDALQRLTKNKWLDISRPYCSTWRCDLQSQVVWTKCFCGNQYLFFWMQFEAFPCSWNIRRSDTGGLFIDLWMIQWRGY